MADIKRILIVDDDQIIRDSLCEFLRLEGYESKGAESFHQALTELEKQTYNLVLTDVNMPEIDGFELLRVIRKRYPHLVTIIITGYGTIESAVEAIKMGAYDYLTKPIVDDEIRILTKRALEAIAEKGIDTELITLSGLDIQPCDGCMVCQDEESCRIEDDLMPIYNKMKEADAIILASPVYFGSATALIKALMERTGYIGGRWRERFSGKVGGPLVVARRAGQNFTFAQIMYWFHILGFFMPGSTYWNIAFGREKGEVANDEEGLATAWNFGKNIAFLVKKLNT